MQMRRCKMIRRSGIFEVGRRANKELALVIHFHGELKVSEIDRK